MPRLDLIAGSYEYYVNTALLSRSQASNRTTSQVHGRVAQRLRGEYRFVL